VKRITGSLPEMVLVADTAWLCRQMKEAVDGSFVHEAIRLFDLAETYLVNEGVQEEREPPYIAVTTNEGGFAKQGFYLTENGKRKTGGQAG
jgi:hypothetical protein